jgi:integration host factor subunit alpha
MPKPRTLTKADIIERVHELGGFTKKDAAEIVEAVFDTIKETVVHGRNVKLTSFGNFVVRDKSPRSGRNPQTGEPLQITARRVVVFKPSHILRNAINSSPLPSASED